MTASFRFSQVDVFSDRPLMGNPLAVVHNADGMTKRRMTEFAAWTNLAETTFLSEPASPQADYKVDIFTPVGSLSFAGHPTLGSCHAWLAAGGKPKNAGYIVQECEIGLVKIRQSGKRLAFAAPPRIKEGPLDEAVLHQIARGLGLERAEILAHQWVDNGAGWGAVMLDSAEKVLALKPDGAILHDISFGVIGPYSDRSAADYEVRAFVFPFGAPEDPVTGSLNAGIAQWLMGAGLAKPSYVVSQGRAMNRQGRVYADKLDGDIWIGGQVCPCIEGTVVI